MCINPPLPPPEKVIKYGKDEYPQVTLIVAPTALLAQWKEEIETHCKKREFRVVIHHGKNKIKTVKELRDMDVVICTYQAIMNSFPAPSKEKKLTEEEKEAYLHDVWETRRKDRKSVV